MRTEIPPPKKPKKSETWHYTCNEVLWRRFSWLSPVSTSHSRMSLANPYADWITFQITPLGKTQL